MAHQPVSARQATRPDSAAWLVVGTLVGLMAEGIGALLAFAVLAGVIALGAPRDTAVATLAVDATQAVSWLAAGILAYEVGRQRAAVILAAALPPCGALIILLGGVVVRRTGVSGHVFAAALYWVAFIVLVYVGGRLWERHLHNQAAGVHGSTPAGGEQPSAEGEGGAVRPGETLQ